MAEVSVCPASRSAIRSSWASRRAGTSTSVATTNPTRPAAERGEVAPDLVVVEQAVPVRAEHRAAPDPDTEPVIVGAAGDQAVVDLVAAQRRECAGAGQRLVGREHDVASSRPSPGTSRTPIRRGRRWAAQHLEAAADAEDGPARRGVGGDGRVEATLAQPGQIGDGGLAAGDHHEVGIGQLGGVGDPAHQHPGFTGQRLDVGGVGHPRQAHRGDPQPLPRRAAGGTPTGAATPTANPRRRARARRRTAARRRWGGRSARAAGPGPAPAGPGRRGTC